MILAFHQTCKCKWQTVENFEDYTTCTFPKNKKLATGLQSGVYCLCEQCASLISTTCVACQDHSTVVYWVHLDRQKDRWTLYGYPYA